MERMLVPTLFLALILIIVMIISTKAVDATDPPGTLCLMIMSGSEGYSSTEVGKATSFYDHMLGTCDEEEIVYLTNQTTPDWEISGTQADQYFGYSRPYAGKALCGMPDTDDNFCDEVFIGSPYWDDTGASFTDSGKVDYYK